METIWTDRTPDDSDDEDECPGELEGIEDCEDCPYFWDCPLR